MNGQGGADVFRGGRGAWETPRPTGSSADDPIHQILLE